MEGRGGGGRGKQGCFIWKSFNLVLCVTGSLHWLPVSVGCFEPRYSFSYCLLCTSHRKSQGQKTSPIHFDDLKDPHKIFITFIKDFCSWVFSPQLCLTDNR